MHDLRRPLITVVSLGLLLAPAALAADPVITLAQADPASDTGIEEELESSGGAIGPPPDAEVFRVKGRAVTAIEQDVPTSATQFDAADIEALGAQSIEDLAKVTPNLEIRTTGATTPTFFIRGVGLSDFNANAPGAISIYQDNIAINAPAIQLGLLYDLENVAIQRGPQGDGPYRNASGGAIQVIGRKPTGAREASLRFDYGNYSFVDVEGAVEIPLTEESLQTRLSFRYVARDGYVTNGCGDIPVNMAERLNGGSTYDRVSFCGESFRGFANPNGPGRLRLSVVPEGLPSKINDRGQWAARAYLRYQPPETDMDFIFNIHGSRLNQLASLGQAIGTKRPGFGQPTSRGYQDKDIIEIQDSLIEGLGSLPLANQALEEILANNLDSDPFRGDFNRVGDTTLDTWGAYLEAHVPIGDVNFRSITGGEWYTRFRETDTDFTPDTLFEIVRTDSAWQITQDFQLRGEMDNTPLKWTTGAFFLTQNLVSDSEFFFFVESQNALQEYEEITYSLGVYGMLDWEFLDDFTLHAGGRYNWENKSFDVALTRADFPKRERTWSAPTGTVSLTYRFTDLVQAYWKYNRGWKGGHFNAASAAGRETAEAEPETINSFEIGMNGTWLDGRLHFDSSMFYYGYEDYQVFIVENSLGNFPQLQIINANNAEVYGLEAALRMEPVDGLVLNGRFAWLESVFLDFTNESVVQTDGGIGPGGISIASQLSKVADFSGNRLINSPQFKASFSVAYTISLGRFGQLIPLYDASWSDDIFFDASEGEGQPNFLNETELPKNAIGQRAFWLHNLRLSYRLPDGRMEISTWVRNVTDQVYKTYSFDASTFSKVTLHFPGMPRTYGGSISFSW